MHHWDDKWKHWNELYQAQEYITKYVYAHSLCRLWSKEKWGTLRYEWIFPPGGRLYNVFSIKIPFISQDVTFSKEEDRLKIHRKYYLGNKGESNVILWRWCDSWLYHQWSRLGRWMLKRAIRKACVKFPNVTKEIMADYYDC